LSGKLEDKPVLAYNGEVLIYCIYKEMRKKMDDTVGSPSDPVTTEEMDPKNPKYEVSQKIFCETIRQHFYKLKVKI